MTKLIIEDLQLLKEIYLTIINMIDSIRLLLEKQHAQVSLVQDSLLITLWNLILDTNMKKMLSHLRKYFLLMVTQ